jgi:hypothetical protein
MILNHPDKAVFSGKHDRERRWAGGRYYRWKLVERLASYE